ncbi:MAG: hypothetical protein JJU34_03300 [Lunatimonas sp.]|uniref:hypothetical protein n=1 Tax=Lunatimonas sp. TaxID=2060141 RepID=UPI00263BCAAE|nr:hypothetical protein [Lunatimonas sp.]MCC5936288.1 hypothetical protein [Lunatimonas sp.]
MKFYIELIWKLFFALSIFPFLLAEKLQEKYEVRIDPQVVDTLFSQPIAVGKLENKDIDEASGLAASWQHPNLLYTHNDSGGEPHLYLMDYQGKNRGKIKLQGVKNRDWEDIAIGPGPTANKSYVYVGEIGDNQGKYPHISLFRFPEPTDIQSEMEVTPETFHLTYPDGPKDAETLMIDPISGDIFILSKRDSSNTLYTLPADKLRHDGQPLELEKIRKLPITMSVAGDISKDGRHIAIKNYWVIYYWPRLENESIAQALAKDPVLLPYKPEPQGEAIAFLPDGSGYFTLSEKRMKIDPVLYRYNRLP